MYILTNEDRYMKVLRDPLLHFLVLGVLLFLIYDWVNPEQKKSVIEISPALISQIEQRWLLQWGRKSTEQELDGLIETHIREQVLSREAAAMELDRDDVIIRRRLVQKLDFLLDDISELEEADESELLEYYRRNSDLFKTEALFSFQHVYINPDKHVKKEKYVKDLLTQLKDEETDTKEIKNYGDLFVGGIKFTRQSLSQVNRIFGRGFAESLIALNLHEWSKPIQSGYGFHLIYPSFHQAPMLPEFSDIHEQVGKHYLHKRRQELKEKAYQQLRQRYEVKRIAFD